MNLQQKNTFHKYSRLQMILIIIAIKELICKDLFLNSFFNLYLYKDKIKS